MRQPDNSSERLECRRDAMRSQFLTIGVDWNHFNRHFADGMVSRIHPDGDSHLQAEGDIPTGLLSVRIAPTTGTNRIYCSLIRRSPNVIHIVKLVRIDE